MCWFMAWRGLGVSRPRVESSAIRLTHCATAAAVIDSASGRGSARHPAVNAIAVNPPNLRRLFFLAEARWERTRFQSDS